jgi:hypothetical protein
MYDIFKKNYLLLIIPLSILVTGLMLINAYGYFYRSTVDPEYAYLINALNLARFKFNVGHMDHPGTPAQVFYAIIMRIKHLFSGNSDIITDVFTYSNSYLKTISFTLIIAISLVTYILGHWIYKLTSDIIPAIFIQSTFFSAPLIHEFLIRVIAEPVLIIAILGLILFLLKYVYSGNSVKSERSVNIIIPLMIGLCIATKIDSFPLLILPFFIYTNWRSKLKGFLLSVAFFFLCAFTILVDLRHFDDWIKVLVLHSGNYGSGPEDIIDLHSIIPRLKLILRSFPAFSVSLFLAIVTIIYVFRKRKTLSEKDTRIYRLLAGILCFSILQMFIVIKHFSFHYFLPSLLFSFTSIYLSISLLASQFSIKKAVINGILLIVLISLPFTQVPRIKRSIELTRAKTEDLKITSDYFQKNIEGKPVIIIPTPYGAINKEFALWFSAVYSHPKNSPVYYARLKKLYSKSYLYRKDIKRIFFWNEEVDLKNFVLKNPTVYICIAAGEKGNLDNLMNNFTNIPGIKTELTKKFENKKTDELIYELRFQKL